MCEPVTNVSCGFMRRCCDVSEARCHFWTEHVDRMETQQTYQSALWMFFIPDRKSKKYSLFFIAYDLK